MDEVDALLVVHAPDEAEQRLVGLLRQAQLALQRRFVDGLALDEVLDVVLRVAVACEAAVVRGVPLAVVDAVGDAAQLPRLLLQNHVQAPAALGRLDLPRVALADGDDARRRDDARLQDVHVLAAHGVVEKEGVAVAVGHLELRELRKGPPPLVRHVVQRQHGARVRHLAVVAVVRLHTVRCDAPPTETPAGSMQPDAAMHLPFCRPDARPPAHQSSPTRCVRSRCSRPQCARSGGAPGGRRAARRCASRWR